MSDLESTENPTEDPNPQPQPQPSTEQTTGAAAESYKFAADAGYLSGKTPEEAKQLVNQLASAVQQLMNQNQQTTQAAQQVAQQAQQQQARPQAQQIDPDLMLSDPATWQQQFASQLQSQVNNTLAQAAQPILAQQAQAARFMSQSNPSTRDVWSKYAAEVDAVASQVPSQWRTKELYDQAASIVRGYHVNELAQEQAQQMLNSYTGVEGSSGGGNADVAADKSESAVWDKFKESPHGQTMLDTLSKQQIRAGAKAMGLPLDKYAERVAGNTSTHSPTKPGEWHTELVRDTNA